MQGRLVPQALRPSPVGQAFAEGGIAAQPGTPEQSQTFIGSQVEKVAAIVRKAGITADN